MVKKIVGEYGETARTCADAIKKADLELAAKCIDQVTDKADFATILKFLGKASLKCAISFKQEIITDLEEEVKILTKEVNILENGE